jgi:hypothetical protein
MRGKNRQMICKMKNLLHSKGNPYQSEKTLKEWEEIFSM